VVILANALTSNTPLTRLSLCENNIGNECGGIGRGAKDQLTEVHLGCNNIGNDGMAAMGEALKINTSLAWLYLSDNSIGDEGAMTIPESPCLMVAVGVNVDAHFISFANVNIDEFCSPSTKTIFQARVSRIARCVSSIVNLLSDFLDHDNPSCVDVADTTGSLAAELVKANLSTYR
jgi:Leucine Rich repeat